MLPAKKQMEDFVLNNTLKLRSGATVRRMTRQQAEGKNYLTREILMQMHLIPGGDPVAFSCADEADEQGMVDGISTVAFYFNPENVQEAPPELWYFPDARTDSMTLPGGSVINRMSIKRAAGCGYYTRERLSQMNYTPIEEPVAFTYRPDKSMIYFYDKRTCDRVPLPCIRCGKGVRFRKNRSYSYRDGR